MKSSTTNGNLFISFAAGYASCAHKDQNRKYSGQPYFTHCTNVAKLVQDYTYDENIIAAALLHDVLEDTTVTVDNLLSSLGPEVTCLVQEVTDVSKPTDGNRAARKAKDREHLRGCSHGAAIIKLADLVDNTYSIVAHDRNFAKIYLAEKEELLEVLRHGPFAMWNMAHETLTWAKKELEKGDA